MSIKETVDRLAGIVAKLPNPSEADGLIRVLRAETERLENMFALGHSLMHDYKVDLESLEEKTASAGEGFFIGALPVYGQAAHDFFVGLENGDGTIAFDHNSSDDINELVQHILSAPTEPVTAPAPAASPVVPETFAREFVKACRVIQEIAGCGHDATDTEIVEVVMPLARLWRQDDGHDEILKICCRIVATADAIPSADLSGGEV